MQLWLVDVERGWHIYHYVVKAESYDLAMHKIETELQLGMTFDNIIKCRSVDCNTDVVGVAMIDLNPQG